MSYLDEVLQINPLVIDGDEIRPHHKYTDDLYMGVNNMATTQEYEAYKQYLRSLNLSSAEYDKKLREWCKRNGY